MMTISQLVYLLIFCCVFTQGTQTSNDQDEFLAPVTRLADFGYLVAENELNFYKDNSEEGKPFLEKFIASDECQLLLRCLPESNATLNRDELKKILKLSDNFMATKDAVKRVFELLYNEFKDSLQSIPSFRGFDYISIQLENYMKERTVFGIEIKEYEIIIDGLEMHPENKKISIWLFIHFSLHFNSFVLRNVPIDSEDYCEIQKIISGSLEYIRIENCPLLFTFTSDDYFDFSVCTNLSEFHFIKCNCRNFLSMFKTVPMGVLTKLSISDNILSAAEIGSLTNILIKSESLVELDVSFNRPWIGKRQRFNAKLLSISTLNQLNMSGNLGTKSFYNYLQREETKPFENLEYLDISNNGITKHSAFNIYYILYHASLFPHLKTLDVSGMIFYYSELKKSDIYSKYSSHINPNECKLKEISTIIYDDALDLSLSEDILINDFIEDKKHFLAHRKSSCSYPKSISRVELLKKVNLKYLRSEVISKDPRLHAEDLQDFRVTDLVVYDYMYDKKEYDATTDKFFSKFTNLQKLLFVWKLSENSKYLSLLLENNSIESFRCIFSKYMDEFSIEKLSEFITDLANVFVDRKFKHLGICYDGVKISFENFIEILIATDFWNELESLYLNKISTKDTFLILNNADLPKLRSIGLILRNSEDKIGIDENAQIFSRKLPFVRNVTITIENPNWQKQVPNWVHQLIHIFPNVADLTINLKGRNVDLNGISSLQNLRSLTVVCEKFENCSEFVEQLKMLPDLNEVDLCERNNYFSDFARITNGKHLGFPALLYSRFYSGYFDSMNTFVIEESCDEPKPKKRYEKRKPNVQFINDELVEESDDEIIPKGKKRRRIISDTFDSEESASSEESTSNEESANEIIQKKMRRKKIIAIESNNESSEDVSLIRKKRKRKSSSDYVPDQSEKESDDEIIPKQKRVKKLSSD